MNEKEFEKELRALFDKMETNRKTLRRDSIVMIFVLGLAFLGLVSVILAIGVKS